MMKDLLPPITEAELQRHTFLAQKGHLGSEEMKEFTILDQKKRESVLTPDERQSYDHIRSLPEPTRDQILTFQNICNKAFIELPKKFMPIKSHEIKKYPKKLIFISTIFGIIGIFLFMLLLGIMSIDIGVPDEIMMFFPLAGTVSITLLAYIIPRKLYDNKRSRETSK